jgi:hypothetical protein
MSIAFIIFIVAKVYAFPAISFHSHFFRVAVYTFISLGDIELSAEVLAYTAR